MLLGSVAPQEVIAFSKDAKLWVLPAGSKTNNPADLLSSDRMKSLMEHCRQAFDYIVIDSPPLGRLSTRSCLPQLADSVVYVVRWAATARELIQQSIKRLPEDKVAGVVFNLLNEKAAQKYGKYAYQYYYGSRSYKKYYEGMSTRAYVARPPRPRSPFYPPNSSISTDLAPLMLAAVGACRDHLKTNTLLSGASSHFWILITCVALLAHSPSVLVLIRSTTQWYCV